MSPEPPGQDAAAVVDAVPWTRRSILKRAAGLMAAGAGGSVLVDAVAGPGIASATTTETGAVAPTVVALTDGPAIAIDASLGNDFRVTINGNRNVSNPTNAVDGQKIVLQVTQGTAAPCTLTWGSGFSFSSGLPQPSLSTTPGQTDLLGFVYNATKGSWLLAAVVNGFAPPASAPPPPPGTFRLFPSTNGPSTPVSYSGNFIAGVAFEVTTGGNWFQGFWWWVCPTGQSTSPQKFALWSLTSDTGTGVLIPGSTVTSTTLTPGQWNYVALPAPLQLAIAATYVAATGVNGSFPDTNGQYGSGGVYSAGIVNGPLTAFSDQSGSLPGPYNIRQGGFTVAGTDPAVQIPVVGSSGDNFWMDVAVSNVAPSGYTGSYRLWPNFGNAGPYQTGDSSANYVLATEFKLSAPCTLDKVWFYSHGGADQLPTQCTIWSVGSQAPVTGTDDAAPVWSGPAGSGWISCDYSSRGVTLQPGDYKVSVFNGAASPDDWSPKTLGYWSTGDGANGITNGPLSAPNAANGSAAQIYQGTGSTTAQSTFAVGTTNTYPNQYVQGLAENYWVDVEVTPAP